MKENNKFYERHIPSYEDINNDDAHNIGDVSGVYPLDNDASSPDHGHQSLSNPLSPTVRRGKRRNYNVSSDSNGVEDDNGGEDGIMDHKRFNDPTIAHVKTGLILLPVDMTLPTPTTATTKEEDANATASLSKTTTAPSYAINQSRLSLYAAFPPPPIIIQSKNHDNDGNEGRSRSSRITYSQKDLKYARQQLKQYSGLHGAMGITTASSQRCGYSETLFSLNYRLPYLISLIPSSLLQQSSSSSYRKEPSSGRSDSQKLFIGNMHYNIQLGSNIPKSTIGSTLTTLDGRSRFSLDVGYPFHQNQNTARRQIIAKNETGNGSDYTISAEHDIHFWNPLRANWLLKISPLPPPVFLSTTTGARKQRQSTFFLHHHLQYLNLTLSNNNNDSLSMNSAKSGRRHDKSNANHPRRVSLSLSYGMPPVGVDGLWWTTTSSPSRSIPSNHGITANYDEPTTVASSAMTHSANMKLDVEQYMSKNQTCFNSLEYRHTDQVLSFGTMVKRTFSSSMFSRLGIGVQYSLGDIFNVNNAWWKATTTRWLFQLERGSVRLLVPITIYPQPLAAWDSLLRLYYASLTSIVLDAILAELLCGVTSKLRLNFLKLIMGDDMVRSSNDTSSSMGARDEVENGKGNDNDRWIGIHLAKAREDSLRQVSLMTRQANAVTKREREKGGLVIINAIYGVMDSDSRQWLVRCVEKSVDNTENSNNVPMALQHTMDATTQLQFWVTDSSLHLPAVSKKHMLGFYDTLAFVSKDEWKEFDKNETGGKQCASINTIADHFFGTWRKTKRATTALKKAKKQKLSVVLCVRYKWGDKKYDVMFNDNEAVDLPSHLAQEVSEC